MTALPRRDGDGTSSAVVTNHLLQDDGEVVADPVSERRGEAGPDGGRVVRHGTSHCPASVTNSDTAATLSLVGGAGRGGARLVAPMGSRKVMLCR